LSQPTEKVNMAAWPLRAALTRQVVLERTLSSEKKGVKSRSGPIANPAREQIHSVFIVIMINCCSGWAYVKPRRVQDRVMRITILGSGTITPDKKRNPSGLAVETSDALIMVDMGPGILRRMTEAEIDVRRVDVALITHFHPDHVSDVVPFLFASNYAYYDQRKEPFHLVGPEGLERFYQGMVGLYGQWIVPTGDRLRIKELDPSGPDSISFGRTEVRSVPSAHSFPSLSYRIEADGSSVTVSGDTDMSEDLAQLAQGTDLLICEASFPDGMKISGHLTPSEAGAIAQRANAKKLALTHFYPPCADQDVVAQAARRFSGEVLQAEDLMVIEIERAE
jgi:ribonuclease BN (tRNA processing enzyme)